MQRKRLGQVLKGMHVKGWEMRVDDSGRKVIYVRYNQDAEG